MKHVQNRPHFTTNDHLSWLLHTFSLRGAVLLVHLCLPLLCLSLPVWWCVICTCKHMKLSRAASAFRPWQSRVSWPLTSVLPAVQCQLMSSCHHLRPVKLIALGQNQTLQVSVLCLLLQPLLLQSWDQHVPFLHCPHDLRQDLLLLLELRGTLFSVWGKKKGVS